MAVISGTTGDDVLTGTDTDDTIHGGDGNDTIDGILGADMLYGDAGNDVFRFSAVQYSSADAPVGLIDGGTGYDTIDFRNITPVISGTIRTDDDRYAFGAYVGSQRFEIRGVERILFGSSNDTINTYSDYAGDLELRAGDGNDRFTLSLGTPSGRVAGYGEAGDDEFFISGYYGSGPRYGLADGGAGNDLLKLNINFNVDLEAGTAVAGNAIWSISGFERVQAAAVSGYVTYINGSNAAETLSVNPALNDGSVGVVFDGRGGDDLISGSAGNDTLAGGDGFDTLTYSVHTGSVQIDLRTGQVNAGPQGGVDRISGFEKFILGSGDDVFIGDALSSVVEGGAGNDTISTLSGAAAYKPDSGFDRIDGGSGTDTLLLGGFRSDYQVLNAGGRTFLVAERSAVEVSGIEQAAFFGSATQAWATAVTGTPAFDGMSYIASYSDLRAAYGTDAAAGAKHFAEYGFGEGRGITFNALNYIASHFDLRAAYGTDLSAGAKHYIEWGASEGRTTTFDAWAYLASYADLIRAYGADEAAAAKHFIQWGAAEGRAATFDAIAYSKANPDLAAAFGSDTEALARHYVLYGFAEGRPIGITSVAVAAHTDLMDLADHNPLPASAFIDPDSNETELTAFGGSPLYADLTNAHVHPDVMLIG